MFALLACTSASSAQLRVVEWNVTNYSAGRVAAFGTAIYGVNPDNGLSMSPDVMICQEFLSSSGVTNFLSILNTAPGSPGDWAASPFINGPDTDNAFFYRSSKIVFLGVTVVSQGGPAPNHPRDVERYDFQLAGYLHPSTIIAAYSSHMKAGGGSDDQARRLVEAQSIRQDAANLPTEWHYLLAADMNIRQSSEDAYLELISPGTSGEFVDPIASPGSWRANPDFRFLHTQDPVGPGGMDDRFDQILVEASLLDQVGTNYLGEPTISYSNSTWNDPNHTYRAWGNDGTTLDQQIAVDGNTMVGPIIAQALKDSAAGQGHLPVLMDIRVPAKVGADPLIDFGLVQVGAPAVEPLNVTNAGDESLWSANGIEDLRYTMTSSSELLSVPEGEFVEAAGGAGNAHVIALDTSTPGEISTSIVISSNAVDSPNLVVTVVGQVVGDCPGDVDGDGEVGFTDLLEVLAAWGPCVGCSQDLDGDGEVAFPDLIQVLAFWGTCK